MKKMPIALLILGLVVTPVWAQSDLEKAVKKAYEKLEDGKPDEAVKELTKATEDGGAPAWVELGKLEERLGRLDEAGEAYKQAQQTATPAYRPDATALLANFTLRTGKASDALALANIAVDARETATTLAARARAQVRSQDGPGALETADKAVGLDASNAMAQLARGEALFTLGRNADAEAALKKAVQLAPDSALAHSRLARVLIALGRPAEAVAAARKATELDESFGEGFAILGGALLAENLNNWGNAIAQAQQGAFLDPQNPIVQTIVGQVFEANGQGDQAASAYRRALDTDPGYAPAVLALIKAEIARGNRDAAIDLAKKAAADMPSAPEIQYLLGVEAARQDDYVAALGFLEKAIKGMPGNADAWALLGRAYQFNKRPDDAAVAYGKAVELAPQNFQYRTTYGLLLGLTGDLAGGEEQLKKVVNTPGYKEEDAWVNLGWIYRNMNKPAESIAAYRKALGINPKQAQASLGLGWAYQATEAYDQAIAAYQQAVQTDPNVGGNAYSGISWCYFFKKDVAKAKEFQAKAEQAGGTDTRLGEWIDKLEKGLIKSQEEIAALNAQRQEEYERAQQFVAASNAVRSSSPARRAQGARDLARYGGREAVDQLIYMMQTDDDYDVRIAATNALAALGRVARKAVPNLEGLLAQEPYDPGLNATPEQLELQMKDYDYRKAMQNALKRIKG